MHKFQSFVKILQMVYQLIYYQLHKKIQSGGFFGRTFGALLKTGLSLMKNVLEPLTKSVLISLGLIAAALARDTAINRKMFESSATTLIISNEEMNDIMKEVKSLKKPCLLGKGINEIIKDEAKEQKRGFLAILLSTLSASLLGKC